MSRRLRDLRDPEPNLGLEAEEVSNDEPKLPPLHPTPETPTDQNQTATGSSNPSVSSTVKENAKRKKRSAVLEDFNAIDGDDGRVRAECKKCGQLYKTDSSINGTNSLRRHLKICPKRENKDVHQMLFGTSDGKLVMKERKFDKDVIRDKITRLVVEHELPLVFVEYKAFRDLISYFFSHYSHIGRNTQMKEISRLHTLEAKRIKDLLKSFNGKVSLTSDMWTSITNDGYISLTVHYIDKDWGLHKKLLCFCIMPPPHSGGHIYEMVSKLLHEWGIENKLFSITLDNAASNICFVDFFRENLVLKNALLCNGEFFHNRCCAHILNLIVQDGLKCIDDSVLKVRVSIGYVTASQSRKVRFLDTCKQVRILTSKDLHSDVSTRWNSTYHMLESALFYRRAFEELQRTDSNYNDCPNADQWVKIEKLTRFLKPFNEITVLISGSKYPTSNLYFQNVWKIHRSLLEEVSSTLGFDFMKTMAQEMKKKFDKYWSKYSLILAIAVVFDPRYKFGFVEWEFNKISHLDASAKDQISCVRLGLYKLFNEYKSMVGVELETPTTTSDLDDTPFSDLAEYSAFNNAMLIDNARKSQLDLYLEEPPIPISNENYHKFDVLSYWKSYGSKYPDVSRMARDVLAIPVSTVASESAFSTGGRVIDKYRTKLLPSNAEALICLQDWLFDIYFRSEPVDDANDDANALKNVLSMGEMESGVPSGVTDSSICSNE